MASLYEALSQGPAIGAYLAPNSSVGGQGAEGTEGLLGMTAGGKANIAGLSTGLPTDMQFLSSAPLASSSTGGGNADLLAQQFSALGMNLGNKAGDTAAQIARMAPDLARYGVQSLSDLKPYEIPLPQGGTAPVFYDTRTGSLIPADFGSSMAGEGGTYFSLKDAGGQAVPGTQWSNTSDKGAIMGGLGVLGLGAGMAALGPMLGGEALAGGMAGPAGATLEDLGGGASLADLSGLGDASLVGPATGSILPAGGAGVATSYPIDTTGAAVGAMSPAASGASSWFSNLANSPVSSIAKALGIGQGGGTTQGSSGGGGLLSTFLSGAQGIEGLIQANQLGKQATSAQKEADPFGAYRKGYAQQLNNLWTNPSTVTQLPGYQAGLEAVQRSLGSQGYMASGNMMAGLSKYGGDFFNQAVQQLSGLAGSQFSPAAGAQLGLEGQASSTQLQQASVGRLALGLAMLGF